MTLDRFADIHTHDTRAGADSIINIEPDSPIPSGGSYSTGIHPWRAAEADRLWPLVEDAAGRPEIVAIGECGLDRLRGPGMDIQEEVFVRHARLAERTGKPLIIHCVRAWAEILRLHSRLRPAVPWIIHGFRGRPALASQLLQAGFHLSLGPKASPELLALVPPDRLHRETDSPAP